MPSGRPSKYTDKLAAEICERLGNGEPLAQICRDDHMPDRSTVHRWGEADESFSQRIACAREDGFDEIAIEALRIADHTADDTIRDPENGNERPNSEWITRSRLRVETRLKLLAKWDPKRYGDKQLIGSDPENPLPPGFVVNLKKGADA